MNPTRRQTVVGAMAAALVVPSQLKAAQAEQPTGPVAARAGHVMARAFQARPAPALSMAVADPDDILWAAAEGQSSLELKIGATTDHRFSAGSVSKVLTATVAARLASRGALDLNAPIAQWMPDLPEMHRKTTLHQLLTHRGGIRHFTPAEIDMAAPGGAIYMRLYSSPADVLRLFIGDPLVASPGSEVRYSSYGYTLASMVMEAAAGHPFLTLVERELGIFDLKSLAADDPWLVSPDRAGRYMNNLDVKMLCSKLPLAAQPRLTDGWANMPFSNPAYSWAGAGFLMTPSDAARFGAAMIDVPGAKLTEQQRALLFTPSTEATKGSPPLGLGWRVDTDKKGRRRWHHAGATPGGCFLLAVYPDQTKAVAIAGNVMTMKMNVLQAAEELVDAFAG